MSCCLAHRTVPAVYSMAVCELVVLRWMFIMSGAAASNLQLKPVGPAAWMVLHCWTLVQVMLWPMLLVCRYCFENDVPINMEGEEAMLDWALDRMGISGQCTLLEVDIMLWDPAAHRFDCDCAMHIVAVSSMLAKGQQASVSETLEWCCCCLCHMYAGSYVAHPLLMTEAPLPPSGARSQLAQLVFEAYGVPALSYVAAAPAAFFHHYNQHHMLQQQQQQGVVLGEVNAAELDPQQLCGSSSGLVICSGHSHSYVVPIYKVRGSSMQVMLRQQTTG